MHDNTHLQIADIFRSGFQDYRKKAPDLPYDHYKAVNALLACKTAALGGHAYRCDHCGHEKISYNSCRNRHCPSCQGANRIEWVQNRLDELLPVSYFHVVFTIPRQLNAFALRNKKSFYDILFKSVSQTMQTLGRDPKRLGGEMGFIAVLHTWGQNLMDHPHVHCVVPAGGITDQNGWRHSRNKDFLFPIAVLAKLFRGKFMAAFKQAVACIDEEHGHVARGRPGAGGR